MQVSSFMKMLKCNYETMGIDMENTVQKTDLLLRLYRKVNWSAGIKIDDLCLCVQENGDGTLENLTCLLEFTPQKDMEIFKSRALAAMQMKTLIDLIDKSAVRIKEYPDSGEVYYSILELRYLNFFNYSESDILEQLDLERSTYYRKKKEATVLLGYILFGLLMPEYIRNQKVANFCD